MRNPIPIKYRKYHCGAIPQLRDSRDLVLGDVPFSRDPATPSWENGFDLEKKYGKLKREHQGRSSSCVGQGWSKHAEMINLIETKQAVDLSARYIYSQIYLPNGGAYIRNGANIIVKQGIATEQNVPSYENGKNPSETFMRNGSGVEEAKGKALTYKSRKYIWLDANGIIDDMRYVIYGHGGFTSGYSGHCMYVCAYGIKDGKKFIKFINSYGEGSDRIFYENDKSQLYDITFLMDLPNDWQSPKLTMWDLKRSPDNVKEVYAISGGMKMHITDPFTLVLGNKAEQWKYKIGDVIDIYMGIGWKNLTEVAEITFSPSDSKQAELLSLL